MSVRARLLSLGACAALVGGSLTLASAPAQAATSVSFPSTVTLDVPDLPTGDFTAGDNLPALPITVSFTGPETLLTPISSVLVGKTVSLKLTLKNVAGGVPFDLPFTVSEVDAGTVSLTGQTPSVPGSYLQVPIDWSLAAPDTIPLDALVGSLGLTGACTLSEGETVPTVGPIHVVAVPGLSTPPTQVTSDQAAYGCTVKEPEPAGTGDDTPGTTGTTPVTTTVPNPCTGALKTAAGQKRTTLTAAAAPKQVKASKRGKLVVKGSYKLGKKKPAAGTVLVCEGAKQIAKGALKKGKLTVKLPKLAVGKHRLAVRFLGAGKAAPAQKTVTVTVKR